MNTPPEPTAEQALDNAWAFIRASEKALKAGEETALEPIESLVGELCQRVLTLPHDEAQRYRPELERLLAALAGLQDGLKDQQHDLRKQINALNLQKHATSAYSKATHMAPSVTGAAGDDTNDSSDTNH